jgi:hypothetical protein
MVEPSVESNLWPPPNQPTGLKSWSDDAWDEQIKRDVAAGRLAKLLATVDADIAKNNLGDMP